MRKKFLRLYRGLSATEFNLASTDLFKANIRTWREILELRVEGDFSYPHNLDHEIKALQKHLRLEYQHFTDSKIIAEGYAKKVGGLLVEIKVPLEKVIKHFDIEFQNFGRRRKQFEVVYGVKGSILTKYGRTWQLKVRRKK